MAHGVYGKIATKSPALYVQLPAETEQYTVAAVNGASIIIVYSGRAKADSCSLNGETLKMKRGSVIFISANESVQLNVESRDSGMLMFRAYCALET